MSLGRPTDNTCETTRAFPSPAATGAVTTEKARLGGTLVLPKSTREEPTMEQLNPVAIAPKIETMDTLPQEFWTDDLGNLTTDAVWTSEMEDAYNALFPSQTQTNGKEDDENCQHNGREPVQSNNGQASDEAKAQAPVTWPLLPSWSFSALDDEKVNPPAVAQGSPATPPTLTDLRVGVKKRPVSAPSPKSRHPLAAGPVVKRRCLERSKNTIAQLWGQILDNRKQKVALLVRAANRASAHERELEHYSNCRHIQRLEDLNAAEKLEVEALHKVEQFEEGIEGIEWRKNDSQRLYTRRLDTADGSKLSR